MRQKAKNDYYQFLKDNRLAIILTLQINTFKHLCDLKVPHKTNRAFINSLKNSVTRAMFLSKLDIDVLKKEADVLKYKYFNTIIYTDKKADLVDDTILAEPLL